MRVGQICPYSLTVPGGVQGQVLGLTRALRAMGIEAQALGPCDGPPPEPWVTPLGNSLPTGDNGSVAAIAPDPAASLRTLRALRDENFDILHIHEPMAPGPSLTATLVGNGPMVGTFHRSGQSNWLRATRPLARWGASHLTVRTAVSAEARQTAAEVMPGEYELVWNGIETDRYASAEPWPSDGPTIFFVGRHESRKGLSALVEAHGRLGPDVRLWVAGHGPDSERLRRATAADPRVEWLGLITEAEKVRRIRGADVLCAPSLHGESFGVVLLEGLAAGVPVVTTDLPGYRNVARPGVEARMVAPGDPVALAKAIEAVFDEKAETAAMVARGLERVERFSMHSLASHYLDIYRRLLPQEAARR
ncbi:MAG TPA: glycosyltransferase family 4 protein [Acidimicrobiales bacterium]|nr:glycosyltransferase family 4 protein [Acidimicrobiales bacterium]